MMPWLPDEAVKPLVIPNLEVEPESKEKPRKSATKKSTNTAPAVATKNFSIPPEASVDIKKALEVSDY